MNKPLKQPELEERFLEPEGWRWDYLHHKNRKLRFGNLHPQSNTPDAVVLILPGRTEFAEKYFETARDLSAHNLAVWILEWEGQGKSDRVRTRYPARCHSPPFENHIDDLHAFILKHIRPAEHEPLVMLGQSMGANIGLHFLHKYPGLFKCAALSTPMLGLNALSFLPLNISVIIAALCKILMGRSYVPGQADWNPHERLEAGAALSSDPARSKIHDAWMESDPALHVGGATFGWVYHAIVSCLKLFPENIIRAIQTPCLIGISGNDTLVDNAATRRAADLLPNATLLEFPQAGHEILMEKDNVRTAYLEAFYNLIKENTAKPPGLETALKKVHI